MKAAIALLIVALGLWWVGGFVQRAPTINSYPACRGANGVPEYMRSAPYWVCPSEAK